MLIVMYKPNTECAVPDAQLKSQAAAFLTDIPVNTNKYVTISQLIMIDAIRAVMVENKISPDLVAFEVYNDDHELLETVDIKNDYALTSWESFRTDMYDFLKTICTVGKYGN